MQLFPLALALGLQAPTPSPPAAHGRAAPVTVRGAVSDEASGAPIPGARLELDGAAVWAVTDSLGRYLLTTEGVLSRRIRVARLGYESQSLEVLLPATGSVRLDIALRATPARIAPVRVLASGRAGARGAPFSAGAPGVRSLTAEELRRHPVLAEPDVLLAFSANADASAAAESPTSFHLRGGSSDQSLVLIDGVPIYNPAHSFGTFGALNPDALGSVELHAGTLSAALGRALAGAIVARTRDADSNRVRIQGGVNATAARLTLDGPLPSRSSTFLISGRWGTPSLFGGRPDLSRVTATFDDWLLKSSMPLATGTVTLLVASAADRAGVPIETTSNPESTDPVVTPRATTGQANSRHRFDWRGTTSAAIWTGSLGQRSELRTSLWSADFDADAIWIGDSPLRMASDRRTRALESALTTRHGRDASRVGVELLHEQVGYSVRHATSGADLAPRALSRTEQGSLAAFAEYEGVLLDRLRVTAGARGTLLLPGVSLFEPRLAARYRIAPSVELSGGVMRTHQMVQSLRNSESLARTMLGANLPVQVGANVPVARADEASAALEASAGSTMRLRVDGYARRMAGLVLPAAGGSPPFAVDSVSLGHGRAWGVGATVDLRGDRLTGYLGGGASGAAVRQSSPHASRASPPSYQPSYVATRSLTAAAALRVSDRTFLRSALFARWGERATLFEGPIDWEGCDAFDGGCEYVGTPGRALGDPGERRVRPYLRLDVGARRSWTVDVGERQALFEAHLTLRNVLDRRNVWAYTARTADSDARPVPLRPLSMLTAGVDFRF